MLVTQNFENIFDGDRQYLPFTQSDIATGSGEFTNDLIISLLYININLYLCVPAERTPGVMLNT